MQSAFFWVGFHLLVALLLVVDLKFFHKKHDKVQFKEACLLSVFWIGLAMVFNGFVYFYFGQEKALQFFAGYVIEKSLSVDNLFIFLLVFSQFQIPQIYQRKILFWGIIGALIFRMGLILFGIVLINQFQWIFYFLGLFLFATGIKMAMQGLFLKGAVKNDQVHQDFESKGVVKVETHSQVEKEPDAKTHSGSKKCVDLSFSTNVFQLKNSWFFRFFKRIFPVAEGVDTGTFFIKRKNKWMVTTLFLALLTIEGADVIFALDSIPAIFAITQDPWIIYTSNVFAILGLRSLYFVLADLLPKLRYYQIGLAAILIFIGTKMFLMDWMPISTLMSLSVIFLILAVTILCSLSFAKNKSDSIG